MKKICIIGFNQYGKLVDNGQSAKVRIYFDKLTSEGYKTSLIDLSYVRRKPFSIFHKIKKSLKDNDVIILLTASNGARILIPFINRINKKYKKKIIYSLIGTSILHIVLDKLSAEETNLFLNQKQYGIVKENKYWNKQLSKIDYILPETDCITDAFKGYFKLNNVFTLTNFRDNNELITNSTNKKDTFVFYGRVCKIKGIFELFDAIIRCREKGYYPKVDIFGPFQLDKDEKTQFDSFLDNDVVYKGIIKNGNVINTLSSYRCLIFPTLYLNEGTPGTISEASLSGLPIISSNFPQLSSLMNTESDCLSYDMHDVEALSNKIIEAMNDIDKLNALKEKSIKNSKKYLYSYNRDFLIKCIEN